MVAGWVLALVVPAVPLALPAGALAAAPAALTQYSNGTDNWARTGPRPAGYALGATLGFLAPAATPGTMPLYGCAAGPDHFLSVSSNCGGQTVLDTEGYIYASAPSTTASAPLYSCVAGSTSGEDNFVSTSPGCGGAASLGLLGYALASAPLNRYNGGIHYVTTGSPPTGYRLEGTLGYLISSGSDTTPLWGCIQGSDQFLAKDEGCEGQTNLGLEGWIYNDPPPNLATAAVYRCQIPGSDHFASFDPNCEGEHTEGLLGYVLQQPVPMPAASTPATTTSIPEPIAPTRSRARVLHVKITLGWHWRHAATRLRRVQIAHLPRGATVRISCRGPGRGCRGRILSARPSSLRRLVRAMVGRMYRAGDRISITVTAPGYESLRARITIRNNKIPIVGLL
jgi:hypothetical protein